MSRILLAALAAFALVAAHPASACDGDCKNCPQHAQKAAAGDAKKDADASKAQVAECACVKAGKPCQCGEKCQCPHCAAKHEAPKAKAPEKKS